MNTRRRSLLQAEILIQLKTEPAKTITELAERMDTSRPSMSRSLRSLKEQGLVFKDKNVWRLTESGETEADDAEEALREAAQSIQKMAVRTTEAFSRLNFDFTGTFPTWDIWGVMAKSSETLLKPYLDLYKQEMAKVNQGLAEMMKQFSESMKQYTQTQFAEFGKEIDRAMQKVEAESHTLAPYLAEANFWLTPSMTLVPLGRVKNLITHGEVSRSAVSEEFISCFEEDDWYDLKRIMKDWRKNPYFSPRMQIIEDALDAHISGKYTLSVPVLVAQAEGIASDILGTPAGKPAKLLKDAMSQEQHTFLKSVSTDIFLSFITSPAGYGSTKSDGTDFTTANFPAWLKSKGYSEGQALNRHGILHGIQIDYPSKENSLRAFLLLDMLSSIKKKWI